MNKYIRENLHTVFFIIIIVLILGFLLLDQEKDFNVVEEGGVKEIVDLDESQIETDSVTIKTSNTLRDKYVATLQKGNLEFAKEDYESAIAYYNEALTYMDSDTAYIKLFYTYNAMGDTLQSIRMIDKAIELNNSYTDYWITKIQFLDEKTDTSYGELKRVYDEAYKRSNSETKINLVTKFAGISEVNGDKQNAISLWTEAIDLYPERETLYQAEIDRLEALLAQ